VKSGYIYNLNTKFIKKGATSFFKYYFLQTMYKMKFSYLFIFVFTIYIFGACTSSKTASTGKQGKGDAAFEKGEYDVALKQYLERPDANTPKILYTIAECYRLSNRPLKAHEFYEKAQSAGSTERNLPFRMAYSKKIMGDYAGAKKLLEKFLKTDSINIDNAILAKKELANLLKIDSLASDKSPYEVQPIEGLNTKGSEFSPMVYNGDLIFTASKKEDIYKSNNLPFLGLYKAQLLNSKQATKIEKFSGNLFDEQVNEGTPTFSKDGNVMVFAKGNTGKKKDRADVDLFSSTKDQTGQWSVPQLISISDSAAWDSSPSFSYDGKTLYFASNREGGLGGIDIYRVSMDAAGRFGTPQNMGKAINTAGDEMFPYAAKDGRLFFASDGQPGLGGLDLFVATRKDGKIIVENLGSPMNSRFDDFALTKFENKKGYFSSNRDGGQGDDDIYYFVDNTPEPVEVEPPVIAKNDPPATPDKPKEPVAIKIIHYFLAGNITDVNGIALDSARVRLIDTNTNLQSAESITVENGKYGKFALETETEYTLLVERPGYFTKRFPFTMVGKEIPQEKLIKPENDTTFLLTTVLEKPAINLVVNNIFSIKTIYYDLNKSNIRGDAAPELDKVVQALNDNPTVKIELGSHTDSRSSAQYNQALSQRRADAAIKYIISKGIDPARLRAKGYGESQLVNKCADGIPCTEEEHQQNRRTEFKVFGLK
jgi:peptidoglycan-associated lipoprotein